MTSVPAARPANNGPDTTGILDLWARAQRMPGGKAVFSYVVARKPPYSASIGARVEELGPGRARLSMRDRPRLRNHLRSIHAIALANLAEFTGGLAMLAGLPEGLRGIVVKIEMEYIKKARGRLEGVCDMTPPAADFAGPLVVPVELFDAEGDVVAIGRFHWKIGPARR